MMKAFKFRLYPTTAQAGQLNQHIGSCRFVYNWALDQKTKTYEQTGKSISRFDLNTDFRQPFMFHQKIHNFLSKPDDQYCFLKNISL